MREEWGRVKWSIFVNPSDPLAKRQPGLWKLETEGTSLIHLTSKVVPTGIRVVCV